MSIRRRLCTNDVFELYAKKGVKITVRKLEGRTVLVEGDRTSLEFLGDLILTYAKSSEHDVQLSPTGAGMARFTKQSTLGLYLHRLPCGNGRVTAPRKR